MPVSGKISAVNGVRNAGTRKTLILSSFKDLASQYKNIVELEQQDEKVQKKVVDGEMESD